jgi:polar amino acid transport system substrate-binding protein
MNLFIVVISGLPIVLTLMICFYIVFSGTGLNEIAIAIIAFSIDFGCYIAITLNSGIESVDGGEIEAAEALGLSKIQVYRKIILPQAVRKIFGVYKRQVISLIKTTSIVGYIAVQDLTKVSDIIRARTYEAFFSLIFTAAIYFIIARICIWALDLAERKLNRRKSNAEK